MRLSCYLWNQFSDSIIKPGQLSLCLKRCFSKARGFIRNTPFDARTLDNTVYTHQKAVVTYKCQKRFLRRIGTYKCQSELDFGDATTSCDENVTTNHRL